MRILFIIQGEGRGHLTQALTLENILSEEGHEIVSVLVGKSPVRQLPDFFKKKMKAPIDTFESPNFLPSAKNKQPNLLKSIGYNILRLHTYASSIRFIHQKIKETKADVVVNFYELLTGLTYLFCRPQAIMVCIAHQYLFLHPDFTFPKLNKVELASLKFFTQVTSIGAYKRLALSFRKMRDLPSEGLVVIPPLLRKEVLEIEPTEGNYLHGYMVNYGFAEEIQNWHLAHSQIHLHFFWDKKDTPAQTQIDSTLTFHQLDDTSFLQYMAGAKAYATTAGFESVCEALYLAKPILMIPSHIEQICNAYDAMQIGAGATNENFNLDILLELSKNHTPNLLFRNWVKQARWIILREFRPDLLLEERPTPLVQKIATRWVVKLGHKFLF
ncbi:glycosyltransferase family protein [Parabacteroides pacaensis]|uniref:glycosyltransferase family protein n=1 Tax=Parabacteroides pacaensis TaxID=2086575 RepID=UPI000D0F31C6|nr:glycosyltransferase family protein [Parabacteroides pacaensis]